MAATKPDRSDLHLPPDVAVRVEAETREYFLRIAPKRPPKPSRSEYSAYYAAAADDDDDVLPLSTPELDKLRELTARPVKLDCDRKEVGDEFIETGYYEGLIRIDKEHHMTGTEYIKMEELDGTSLDIKPEYNSAFFRGSSPYKGNPATNDWTPTAADIMIPVSNKPNRSDA